MAPNKGALGFNDDIIFKVLSAQGRDVAIAYPSRIEYICTVELLDSRGTNVTKTSLGRKVGSQWDTLKRYAQASPQRSRAYSAPYDISGGRRFYKLSDLFVAVRAGKYRLRTQFQVYQQVVDGTNSSMVLTRFAPIELRISVD